MNNRKKHLIIRFGLYDDPTGKYQNELDFHKFCPPVSELFKEDLDLFDDVLSQAKIIGGCFACYQYMDININFDLQHHPIMKSILFYNCDVYEHIVKKLKILGKWK